ncbi:thioredoxin [Mesorhizobium sp. CAU 1732]|uniref:thioredoxin n=1 Tax=Mesorhizobium sp. CAU 1732 TaxID=3140358 RepID=UPI003260BA86
MSAQDNPYGNGQFGGYAVANGNTPGDAGEAAAAVVKDTTTATFPADVIQESRNQPVLVDFWAPWCGPCKQLQPALEKAVAESGGRVKLVKMNIDDHPSIAGQLGIQSIPAVIAFRDGQPVDGFMGAIPESKILEFIDKVAGPSDKAATADALAAAAEVRAEGDLQGATQIYATILRDAPDNIDAIAGLAEVLFELGDTETAREVLARVPEGQEDAPQLAGIKAQFALAEQVSSLGDPAALERALAENPRDHQARFDLALIQNAMGERQQAADSLLEIMRADREWQDDGARLQLLKFFEAWGMTDEATLAARRKLSSLLFS